MVLDVDHYLADGCMRCSLGGTPQCKVHAWKDELVALRHIALDSGLTETVKWGVPCYTFEGKNVAVVSAFKEYASLSFFKGALLRDPENWLVQRGENSQAARLLVFTDVEVIFDKEAVIKSYLLNAIDIEKAGAKVLFDKAPEPLPEELLQKFEEDAAFKQAFFALTPGRQRGYVLHFSDAKQAKTRLMRIEKYVEQIKKGIGLMDHYKAKKEG